MGDWRPVGESGPEKQPLQTCCSDLWAGGLLAPAPKRVQFPAQAVQSRMVRTEALLLGEGTGWAWRAVRGVCRGVYAEGFCRVCVLRVCLGCMRVCGGVCGCVCAGVYVQVCVC